MKKLLFTLLILTLNVNCAKTAKRPEPQAKEKSLVQKLIDERDRKWREERMLQMEFDHLFEEKVKFVKRGEMCNEVKLKCYEGYACSFEGQFRNDDYGRCKEKHNAQPYHIWMKIRKLKYGY